MDQEKKLKRKDNIDDYFIDPEKERKNEDKKKLAHYKSELALLVDDKTE